MKLNTPCKDCDVNYEGGGAFKPAEDLFRIGWHVHKSGESGHVVFIDDVLLEAYTKRYPGGPLQQLVEASEDEPT